MAKLSQGQAARPAATPLRPSGSGVLFGVPVGDLGWFTSLIMGLAVGFAAFFAATFVAIISILLLNSFAHRTIDYTLSYRRIGLPIGLVIGLAALSYLGSLWVRRHLRRA